jgi:hypothetical protein
LRWIKQISSRHVAPAFGAVAIVTSGIWMASTLLRDYNQSLWSPILVYERSGLYAFSVVTSLVGIALPLLLVVRLWPRAKNTGPAALRSKVSFLGTLLIALAILSIFYLVERIIPVSVVPFSTCASGIAFAAAGFLLLRYLQPALQMSVLAAGLIFILSVRFVDWNSRKPFLRDLYKVRLGMSVPDVQSIMGGYLTTASTEEPEFNKLEDELIVYRPSNEAAYNADLGEITVRSGRVVAVRYLGD